MRREEKSGEGRSNGERKDQERGDQERKDEERKREIRGVQECRRGTDVAGRFVQTMQQGHLSVHLGIQILQVGDFALCTYSTSGVQIIRKWD